MMWYMQLLIDLAAVTLTQVAVLNAVFACLTLWAAIGNSPRVCLVLTALVHLFLMLS